MIIQKQTFQEEKRSAFFILKCIYKSLQEENN